MEDLAQIHAVQIVKVVAMEGVKPLARILAVVVVVITARVLVHFLV